MEFSRIDFKLLDKIVLGRATFTPPFKASDAFENEARFVYVINGNSRLYSAKSSLDLQAGDSMLMRCENFVNNWVANEDDAPNSIVVFHFYPEVLKYIYNDLLPEVFSSKHSGPIEAVEKISPNALIDNYFSSLKYYLENPSFLTDDLLKVKIQELILILLNSDATGKIKAMLSSLFKAGEYEFKEIIHSHLFEDLKIEDLAFFTGLSLSSFKRKFKEIFGTSPTQYIKGKRLEKAQQLLEKTELRISEIAYDCGFNDIGYFSKAFSAVHNCSPSEYRKMYLA